MRTSTQSLLQVVASLLLLALPAAAAANCEWSAWQHFRTNLISEDGRVIDYSSPARITTSEGQSYGLFFALVANDPETFDRLVRWTDNNLADASLGDKLPAWLWGMADNGEWKVLDGNAASDSDVWIAYSLLEAGRIWGNSYYQKIGKQLAATILREEVVNLPGYGDMLLPGPYGFNPEPGLWRLNPSYLPLQLLRYLGRTDARWLDITANSRRLLLDASPRGFAPDWVEFRLQSGITTDANKGPIGSYDAIRVYLWAGMLAPEDSARAALLERWRPMRDHVKQHAAPPRKVNTETAVSEGTGPSGFSAALLPFLSEPEDEPLLISQLTRLLDEPPWAEPKAYYNQVLGLFGTGWHSGRYRFDRNGQLVIGDAVSCH